MQKKKWFKERLEFFIKRNPKYSFDYESNLSTKELTFYIYAETSSKDNK